MRKALRHLTSLILALGMLSGLAGCAFTSAKDVLVAGAGQFLNGREEEDYSIRTSAGKLQTLLDHYSGSYQNPAGSRMSESEYERARHETGGSPGGSSAESSSTLISAEDELFRLFHEAYNNTSEYVVFTLDSGLTFDIGDVETIYRKLQREDPYDVCALESFRVGCTGSDYIVQLFYGIDVDELIRIKQETRALVRDAVAQINTGGMNGYETVCAVNQYLCDTFAYPDCEPYAAETHLAYGGLKNASAVCEGYACAAKMMLNELGIACDIETGTCTNGGGHAWNLVQLDGKWYQMDVTWNDCGGDPTAYLLVTDEMMRQSRVWDEANYPATPSVPYRP